jgi:hypothetical protein
VRFLPRARQHRAEAAGAVASQSGQHQSPTRALRVFPGVGAGISHAALFEDDGQSLVGASTRVTISMSWAPNQVRNEVGASGNYPLPYREMRVILPGAETRTVELSGPDRILLRL